MFLPWIVQRSLHDIERLVRRINPCRARRPPGVSVLVGDTTIDHGTTADTVERLDGGSQAEHFRRLEIVGQSSSIILQREVSLCDILRLIACQGRGVSTGEPCILLFDILVITQEQRVLYLGKRRYSLSHGCCQGKEA